MSHVPHPAGRGAQMRTERGLDRGGGERVGRFVRAYMNLLSYKCTSDAALHVSGTLCLGHSFPTLLDDAKSGVHRAFAVREWQTGRSAQPTTFVIGRNRRGERGGGSFEYVGSTSVSSAIPRTPCALVWVIQSVCLGK